MAGSTMPRAELLAHHGLAPIAVDRHTRVLPRPRRYARPRSAAVRAAAADRAPIRARASARPSRARVVAECAHARRRRAPRPRSLRRDGCRGGPDRPIRQWPRPGRAGSGPRRARGGRCRTSWPTWPAARSTTRPASTTPSAPCSSASAPSASPTSTRSTPTACSEWRGHPISEVLDEWRRRCQRTRTELRQRDGGDLPTMVGSVPGALAGVPPGVRAGHPRRRHRRAAGAAAGRLAARASPCSPWPRPSPTSASSSPPAAPASWSTAQEATLLDRRPGGRRQRPAAGRPSARRRACGPPSTWWKLTRGRRDHLPQPQLQHLEERAGPGAGRRRGRRGRPVPQDAAVAGAADVAGRAPRRTGGRPRAQGPVLQGAGARPGRLHRARRRGRAAASSTRG